MGFGNHKFLEQLLESENSTFNVKIYFLKALFTFHKYQKSIFSLLKIVPLLMLTKNFKCYLLSSCNCFVLFRTLELNFLSNNIKGLRGGDKRIKLFEYFNKPHEINHQIMAWWIFSSHGRTNSSGVSIDYFASTAKKIVLCAGPIGRNYIKKTKRCRNYWNIRKHWFLYLENQKPKLNPFVSDALFLYLLKTSENLTVVRCFQGVEKGFIGNEWVTKFYFTANSFLKLG